MFRILYCKIIANIEINLDTNKKRVKYLGQLSVQYVLKLLFLDSELTGRYVTAKDYRMTIGKTSSPIWITEHSMQKEAKSN